MDLSFVYTTSLWTTLLLTVLGFFSYRYLTATHSYWKKRGVVFVPAKPIFGSIPIFARIDPKDIAIEWHKKYGRIYGTYEGRRPVLNVAEPDLLRSIFVKDFPVFHRRRDIISGDPIADNMAVMVHGEKWKRLRSIISPTFTTGKIKRMTDIILDSAKTATKNFADQAGQPVDAKEIFGCFTMDVIASVAFGTKIHSHQDPNNRFVQEVNKAFRGSKPFLRFMAIILFPGLSKSFGVGIFDKNVMKFLKEIILEIIQDRKKTGKGRNDFLQLLIDTQKEIEEGKQKQAPKKDEEGAEENIDDRNAKELGHEENNAQFSKMPEKMKVLSHDELIAQCVMFFLAGFDTVSSTLAFTIYMLALNPEVQDKLREEVDTVILEHDGKLTYDAIQEMKFLDNVLTETLRMYPPVFRIERVAEEDYPLGDTGIIVEKNTIVVIPVYAMHYDPEFYPDPEKFMPERFTAEQRAKRHPYSYVTFGAGPRNCVGMRFALMEIKFCLAYVISQLIVKPCKETKVPLEISATIGIIQPKDVTLCFKNREDKVFDGL